MQSVDAPTLILETLGTCAVLVHGATAPSDADWSRYLDALVEYSRERPTVNLLVVADVGPSAAQRAELARRAPKGGRTAVISSSALVRGIVRLIGWVEPNIRAFAPTAIRAGLDYLQVPENDRSNVLAVVNASRAKLGLAAPSSRKPRGVVGRVLDALGLSSSQTREQEMAAVIDAFEQRDREFQRELYDARTFQQRLVTLPTITGATVQSFYEPMGLIGGDLYTISQHGTKVRVFIADATGHGIRAAMTTMFIRHGYEGFSHCESPSEVLDLLNDSIASAYRSSEMMFTAACADIDTATGEVTVASAAHPPACVVRDGEVVLLETDGAPMGVKPGMKFESASLTLGRGDGFYLYTDGITEARAEQRQLGDARLHATIRDAHRRGDDVAAKVRAELFSHVGNYSLSDDASFIGVRLE